MRRSVFSFEMRLGRWTWVYFCNILCVLFQFFPLFFPLVLCVSDYSTTLRAFTPVYSFLSSCPVGLCNFFFIIIIIPLDSIRFPLYKQQRSGRFHSPSLPLFRHSEIITQILSAGRQIRIKISTYIYTFEICILFHNCRRVIFSYFSQCERKVIFVLFKYIQISCPVKKRK